MKTVFKICIGITILEFIVAIIVYGSLPEIIPTHWGISGEIDSYGNKIMIFLAPVMSLAITLIMYFAQRFDPKGENLKKSGKAYPVVMISINIIMAMLLTITILESKGYSAHVNIILPIFMGIMFMLIGNYMPKIKPNHTMGIRLPWTMTNDIVWTKTHRFGGWVFFIIGFLFIAGIVLPSPYNFSLPIVGLFAGIILISIFSYIQFKKIKS